MAFHNNGRFERFEHKVWLSSPTMHPESFAYVKEAFDTNWMSTVGANLNELEKIAAKTSGVDYAVALACGTAALHMSTKLAGEKLYGRPQVGHGALEGKRVFCSDMTFDASVNPIVYEGGIPIFIDTDATSWNMDPDALERAFECYPEVRLVVTAELYGFSGDMARIREICHKHGALLIEDAAEALGATWKGTPCGSFGDYAAMSYNGNKIITGSSGGCFLTNSAEDAEHVRKWSTQSRENAPWYQHTELGYNYRMSNVIGGVARGQYPYLAEHIAQKKAIYERYRDGLHDLPIMMNPIVEGCVPNYWLSAMVIEEEAMCSQTRTDREASFVAENGKSCPTEILNAIAELNAEGRPIWKPMHMQPMYADHAFVKKSEKDVGADIFARGLCLPSDNKMTAAEQERIIAVIRACFE